MQVIEIIGMASRTSRYLEYSEDDLGKNLLLWLREKCVTIASSCDGHGVCKKCAIQNELLTCELTLKTFFERFPDGKIFIGYL